MATTEVLAAPCVEMELDTPSAMEPVLEWRAEFHLGYQGASWERRAPARWANWRERLFLPPAPLDELVLVPPRDSPELPQSPRLGDNSSIL